MFVNFSAYEKYGGPGPARELSKNDEVRRTYLGI